MDPSRREVTVVLDAASRRCPREAPRARGPCHLVRRGRHRPDLPAAPPTSTWRRCGHRGTTAFVTGGQIGLGAALTSELLARGATKVYVASRHPVDSSEPRVVPLALDIRDPDQVAAAAARADDVSLLVNNAGVFRSTDLLSADVAEIRDEFDTNVFGTLAVVRAFAPVLAAHGGGAVVNVLSVLAWASARDGYSASRAALWSVTNGLRSLLVPSGTLVTGVHVGWMDTLLTAAFDVPKAEVAGELALPAGAVPELFIDVEDLADVATTVLTGPGRHSCRVHELTGPGALTPTEAGGLLSQAPGLPMTHPQTNPSSTPRHWSTRA